MKRFSLFFTTEFLIQLFLFIFVNGIFILKYIPRAGVNSAAILGLYLILILFVFWLYTSYLKRLSEKILGILFWLLLSFMVISIIGLLIKIDPYTVRVDRWSAVSFFLDAWFNGQYPYSAHTHVSSTNFASPFPIWHIINIPFYFIGDVGVGLIFFLIGTAITVKYYFSSYKIAFLFILMVFISPAYWWEVAVRSDSLSNALLVFIIILLYLKSNFSIATNYLLTIILCGLIASTRLSAIIPLALFFFKPYINLSWLQKLTFPLAIILVVTISFLPFILWDTENWIFFSRNPFMSQTSVGNPLVLMGMLVLGVFLGYRVKGVSHFFTTASSFIFLFVMMSQLSLMITRGVNGSVFEDSLYDVSYFSLLLPYCLAYLSQRIQNVE